jgi:putative transposase
VDYLHKNHLLKISQACKIVSLCRSMYYYKASINKDDQKIISLLNELAEKHPTYGFWKLFHSLKNQGHAWNHKKVYRIYTALKMNLKRKRKRRLPDREKQSLEVPKQANEIWSMDFMSDALVNGRNFRTLNIIDDFNRESIWIDIAYSIPSALMVNLLEWIIKEKGKPQTIRVDNGPEFISATFTNWCHKHRIEIRYIQPGKPTQNAYIERFNRSYRTEILDAYRFESLKQVKELTHQWMEHYNQYRPHESLQNLSPIDFKLKNLLHLQTNSV